MPRRGWIGPRVYGDPGRLVGKWLKRLEVNGERKYEVTMVLCSLNKQCYLKPQMAKRIVSSVLVASPRTKDGTKSLGRGVPADTLKGVTVVTSLSRGGGTDLMSTGGVEVLDAIPVSVNRDGLDVVTRVSRSEGPESCTFRSVVVLAELTVGGGADLVNVGGVEVVNSVPVSVDWNSLESMTWVPVSKSVEADTFGSVTVVTNVSRSGGTDLSSVGSVEVVFAVPISEDWDLGNLDWDWFRSDNWLDVVMNNGRSGMMVGGVVVSHMMMVGNMMVMMMLNLFFVVVVMMLARLGDVLFVMVVHAL